MCRLAVIAWSLLTIPALGLLSTHSEGGEHLGTPLLRLILLGPEGHMLPGCPVTFHAPTPTGSISVECTAPTNGQPLVLTYLEAGASPCTLPSLSSPPATVSILVAGKVLHRIWLRPSPETLELLLSPEDEQRLIRHAVFQGLRGGLLGILGAPPIPSKVISLSTCGSMMKMHLVGLGGSAMAWWVLKKFYFLR